MCVYVCVYVFVCVRECVRNHKIMHIKTHGSESRGQEEAAVRDKRVSYLHVALL